MKVVILCGGMGTRLKEETEFRPKPMVMIGNRPILWHIMKIYAAYGHSDFVLCLGYKGEMIKQYFYHYEIMANDFQVTLGKRDAIQIFHNHGERDWKILLANTGEKTLKGGRLKRVERYVDTDDFLVTYGDGVADIDIQKLVEFHKRHGKIATLTGVRPIARFGELKVSGDQVSEFQEKPQSAEGMINGGFFVFNRRIFDYLEEREDCDLEYGALEKLASQGELMIYRHDGFWACMDTLRDAEYLNRLWTQDKASWKVW
jgi:glucose-1-phosphate cytidylyltransferase